MGLTALTRAEIVPGVVVQLDTDAIRATRRAKSNAELVDGVDRAVRGEHSFLVLRIAPGTDTVVLAPVFSRIAPGSEVLDEGLKSGFSDRWLGVTLYLNRWQHWEVRAPDVVTFSAVEDTPDGNRRMYAADVPAELDRILALRKKNRAPWRSLS
jgi:hypothetical protein